MGRTFAIVKPGVEELWGVVIYAITSANLTIEGIAIARFDQTIARKFYAEHITRGFYGDLENYVNGGRVLGMELAGDGAIKKWRELIGPTDPLRAKAESPTSIRAMYGHNSTANVCHGSDSE